MAFKPEEVSSPRRQNAILAAPTAPFPVQRGVYPQSLLSGSSTVVRPSALSGSVLPAGAILLPGFLVAVTKAAVARGYLFDRVMTNGVWWSRESELVHDLTALRDAGYDGRSASSVDAFHRQSLSKVARLIREAVTLWRRPDVVSLACVFGAYDKETITMLRSLARLLNGRLAESRLADITSGAPHLCQGLRARSCSGGESCGITRSVGQGVFKDDRCKGPGNVFLVMPDGDVKPCCGYASDLDGLTIGNIKKDTAKGLLRRIRSNRFAMTVFNQDGPAPEAARARGREVSRQDIKPLLPVRIYPEACSERSSEAMSRSVMARTTSIIWPVSRSVFLERLRSLPPTRRSRRRRVAARSRSR